MASKGTIWAELGLRLDKFNQGLRQAESRIREAEKRLEGFEKVGERLSAVGKNLTLKVTAPIVAMATLSVKAFADFDDAMTGSLAIMGDVSDEMRAKMEATARNVAKTTRYSATQAADAYFYLASAGLDAAQSIEAMPRVAQFAAAGKFDLARATDLLTDAQSALGMTIRDDVVKNMENMTRVSDVLVKANTLANATVEQFSASLTNKAGAALRLLNKDIEEGTAVLAAWADQGVKGEAAGEQLNIVLRDLQTASLKNREEFDRLGISVYDSEGNMRNIADVIGDLEGALAGMSDEQRRATLMTLGFQDRSVSAMLTLLGTSDSIRTYEAALRDAAGVTDEVARKQLESLSARLDILKSRVMDNAITIGERLVPMVERLMDRVERATEWFDRLDDRTLGMIVTLGLLAAATGPVMQGVLALGAAKAALAKIAEKQLVPAITKAALAMKGFLASIGPIGWAILALGAIVTAFLVAWHNNWGNIRERTEYIAERIKAAFWSMVAYVGARWNELKLAVYEAVQAILDLIAPLARLLPGPWREGFEEIRRAVDEKVRDINRNLESLAETSEAASARAARAVDQLNASLAKAATVGMGNLREMEAGVQAVSARMGYLREQEAKLSGQTQETAGDFKDFTDVMGGSGGSGGLSNVIDIVEYKIKRLDNALALLQATSRDAEDSADILAEKKRILSEKVALAAERLVELEAQYKRVVAAHGEYSEAAIDLALRIDDLRVRQAEWTAEINGTIKAIEDLQKKAKVDVEKRLDALELAASRGFWGLDQAQVVRDILGDMVPKFHDGGTFRAPRPGGEGLAWLRDRETVLPPGAGMAIDYERLGQAIARYVKPSVRYESHHHGVKEEPASAARRKDEMMLRRLAMEWGIA